MAEILDLEIPDHLSDAEWDLLKRDNYHRKARRGPTACEPCAFKGDCTQRCCPNFNFKESYSDANVQQNIPR